PPRASSWPALFPYTTLFRSAQLLAQGCLAPGCGRECAAGGGAAVAAALQRGAPGALRAASRGLDPAPGPPAGRAGLSRAAGLSGGTDTALYDAAHGQPRP